MAEKKMAVQPEWEAVLRDVKRATKDGRLPSWYKHVLMQTPRPVGNAGWYIFALLHSWIVDGHILGAMIELSEGPKADADHDGNQTMLDSLPHPFTGRFWGGMDLSDGIISWSESIQVSEFFTSDGQEPRRRLLKPGTAQLEVGYTKPETTLFQLATAGQLVRIPYRSRVAFLLVPASNTLAEELGYWLQRGR